MQETDDDAFENDTAAVSDDGSSSSGSPLLMALPQTRLNCSLIGAPGDTASSHIRFHSSKFKLLLLPNLQNDFEFDPTLSCVSLLLLHKLFHALLFFPAGSCRGVARRPCSPPPPCPFWIKSEDRVFLLDLDGDNLPFREELVCAARLVLEALAGAEVELEARVYPL